MIRFPVLLLTCLVGSLFTSVRPASAQEVTLRWKYEVGTELLYRMTSRSETQMPMGRGSMGNEQVQTVRWRVAEVAANGDATITLTTETIKVTSQSPTGDVSYDSETDLNPSDPQTQMYARMVGSTFTMVISPRGSVKSVSGMEQMIEEMREVMPAEAAEMGGDMIEQMFGEEGLTNTMQRGVQLFPEQAVGPGSTWQSAFSIRLPMMGIMTTTMDFTLTGFEQRDGRSIAIISSGGEMVLTDPGDSPMAGMMEVKDGEVTGSMHFDMDRGLIVFAETATRTEMGVSAGPQSMSMVSTSTNITELLGFGAAGG